MEYQLDSVDFQILKLLQKDGKLKIKEISDHINLSTSPVFERIKRLEKEGFINGYKAVLNSKLLGYKLIAFCSVTLENHQTKNLDLFIQDVKRHPEITECHHIAGLFDFLLKIVVKDMEDYQKFVTEKLAVITSVARVQSSFVMTEIKKESDVPLV